MRRKDFLAAKKAFKEKHPNLYRRVIYSRPFEADTVIFYIDDGTLIKYDLTYRRTFVLKQRWKS